MTKYILHGGNTSTPSEDNTKFFLEMTRDLQNPVKVLCIYFSRPEEEWDRLFGQDQEHFKSANPEATLIFERADNNPETFKSQLSNNNVIYMRGGNTEKLLAKLKEIDNFKELTRNKVISGSSAGAYVLSRYFHQEKNGGTVMEGLGLVNAKTVAHFSKDMDKYVEDLENYGNKAPILKIPEEKFFVIQD